MFSLPKWMHYLKFFKQINGLINCSMATNHLPRTQHTPIRWKRIGHCPQLNWSQQYNINGKLISHILKCQLDGRKASKAKQMPKDGKVSEKLFPLTQRLTAYRLSPKRSNSKTKQKNLLRIEQRRKSHPIRTNSIDEKHRKLFKYFVYLAAVSLNVFASCERCLCFWCQTFRWFPFYSFDNFDGGRRRVGEGG